MKIDIKVEKVTLKIFLLHFAVGHHFRRTRAAVKVANRKVFDFEGCFLSDRPQQ